DADVVADPARRERRVDAVDRDYVGVGEVLVEVERCRQGRAGGRLGLRSDAAAQRRAQRDPHADCRDARAPHPLTAAPATESTICRWARPNRMSTGTDAITAAAMTIEKCVR